jgi:hypothetical protein
MGKVRFPDGSPLPGGVIIFESKDTGIQARARIKDDGTFVLGTLSKDDGSVAGVHRVSVRPKVLGIGMAPKHPIQRKFHSVLTSGLEVTVKTDEPNEFDIVVERSTDRRDAISLPDS